MTSSLTACGGGGGGSNPLPTPTPPPVVINCAAGGTSVARQGHIKGMNTRLFSLPTGRQTAYVPGVVEVLYKNGSGVHAMAHAAANGSNDMSFERLGTTATVLHVAAGTESATMAKLRAQPGVVAVSQPRYETLHSASPLEVNDPYFIRADGAPPYYQTAGEFGQWDMHAISIDGAWGYSQPGATVVNAGATGANSTIAVIDTGLDTTHPDIAPKLASYSAVYDKGDGTASSTAMHDCDGHGTNVAGIAAADTNNAFGFAGAGFNAKIMPFKVFPDTNPSSTTNNATASSTDVAAAINDAVAHNVQVISLSLGATPSSGTCQTGGEDPVQAQAVANAIANGVVVVASSGNESASTLDCPGGDLNVIAVGASALDDYTSPPNITEYVASYSNYDAHLSSWGVVAPGGDPQGTTPANDTDYFHWIVNTWTSLAGPDYCSTDPFGGVGDCREAIAGTSQAAPHVAGLAALLMSASPGIAPATVRSIICSTADPINATPAKYGCGRIDAYRAMARVLGDTTVASRIRKTP